MCSTRHGRRNDPHIGIRYGGPTGPYHSLSGRERVVDTTGLRDGRACLSAPGATTSLACVPASSYSAPAAPPPPPPGPTPPSPPNPRRTQPVVGSTAS